MLEDGIAQQFVRGNGDHDARKHRLREDRKLKPSPYESESPRDPVLRVNRPLHGLGLSGACGRLFPLVECLEHDTATLTGRRRRRMPWSSRWFPSGRGSVAACANPSRAGNPSALGLCGAWRKRPPFCLFVDLLNQPECVELTKVLAFIADDLHWHVREDCIATLFVENLFDSHPLLDLDHQDQYTPIYQGTTFRPGTIGMSVFYAYWVVDLINSLLIESIADSL
jgi:hypothetical protein